MSDINKDVAMGAEENLDGESVRGEAGQGTETGGIAATEERREGECRGEEEKKDEGEKEEKTVGDPARIERGFMAHPASGIDARHSIFS